LGQRELYDALEGTSESLSAAMKALPEELRDRRPSENEWSATEIVRHVLASDAISSPRVVQILVRPGAPLPAFDERAWANQVAQGGTELMDSLMAFSVRRQELVGILRSLTARGWNLAGEHEHRGTLTVSQICHDLITHEENHERQMTALVAKLTRDRR